MDEHTHARLAWAHHPFTVGVIGSILGTLATIALVHTYAPEMLGVTVTSHQAHEKSLQPYNTDAIESVPDVVARATPAVVSIVLSADVPVIERYYEEYNPFGRWFGGGGFQIPRERQIGTEKQTVGGGTGFIVSADGYIVTNKHVVDTDDVAFSVVTNEGNTYDVDVVPKDPVFDIAILKIKGDGPFPALQFGDSDQVRLGESVIAIGNALAEFPNSVSVGVISGLSRDIVARDSMGSAESLDGVMQTDAAINPGNSGGPLLNRTGEVIGVNVAVANGSENIGFSLPGNMVKQVYASVREHGEIVRPYVGIRYITITEALAKENQLPVTSGILVVRGDRRTDLAVIPGSPADKAGIEENDIILRVDDVVLDDEHDFARLIREYRVGDVVTLTVLHDGEERVMTLTLEKAPNE